MAQHISGYEGFASLRVFWQTTERLPTAIQLTADKHCL